MDRKARPETKSPIRIKVVVLCVAAVLALPVVGNVIGYFYSVHQQRLEEEAAWRRQDDFERDLPYKQMKKRAWDDALAERISWREYDRISRMADARKTNAHDLKQAQDDFDAGHIGIGELHRIQREVRDRERSEAP